ncbi:3-methyladenine DNA glycosylase AlkD [Planomicrobium stackebrandtii]|uniref:3-methyladenine DNA glycosylase AlkD n=1 Tax=Planomicrobium stackebrandtii TaxID=253160 RepID=A0ABU0GZX4_9BACL|nr:DNA alkylation repair protein [Planomicrobium stackebrandtii]MDQ0430341.1 3-methyladenine DNA glycosylase AlkD [Planomicrobium stackebrandtii]
MRKKTWDHKGIIVKFEANRNDDLAIPMAAYMRHQFDFLGIKTPLRKALLREQFLEYQLPDPGEISEEVWKLYNLTEREYQYAAIALLEKMKKQLTIEDLPFLQELIESKSWWDSVDSIAPRTLGHVIGTDRAAGRAAMFAWSESPNMWTNRAAILHQLKYKQQTDTTGLSHIILQHATSSEFFIQKSIGWALREYAKTDADWVQSFIFKNSIMPLSKREALKNIKNSL